MAVNKQGRQLPTWYLDKVNMASEVCADNPDKTDMRRPHINPTNSGGGGVSAQRHGRMTVIHPGRYYRPGPVKLDLDEVAE